MSRVSHLTSKPTALQSEEWAHLGSNQGKVPARTLDGWPTFLTATALTASLIPWPSMWQVMGLGALWFLTLFGGRKEIK